MKLKEYPDESTIMKDHLRRDHPFKSTLMKLKEHPDESTIMKDHP